MINKAWKHYIDFRLVSMCLILAGLFIFFRIQVGGFYFSGESISKLVRDMSTWGILGAGVTLIIIAGHIDLSIGSQLAVTSAACALLLNPEYGPGFSTITALLIVLCIGPVIGFLQGYLTAYMKIPSFIVTLGGLFIFRGVTQKISAYDPRVPDSSWILSIGFDYLSPVMGWVTVIIVSALFFSMAYYNRVTRKKRDLLVEPLWLFITKSIIIISLLFGFINTVNGYRGLPLQTLIMFIILLLLFFILKFTTFGRRLYAIGGNAEAARLSGIRSARYITGVFMLMGLLAGIAGIMWMAQNQGSTKNAGEFYELYAIAAAVIGGASLNGGKGTIIGTFLGGLVMATVIQGMDYSNLDNWLQLVVRGAVLVAAVGIDVMSRYPPEWLVQWRFRRGTKF
jgi:D-xylose transport system permease protein